MIVYEDFANDSLSHGKKNVLASLHFNRIELIDTQAKSCVDLVRLNKTKYGVDFKKNNDNLPPIFSGYTHAVNYLLNEYQKRKRSGKDKESKSSERKPLMQNTNKRDSPNSNTSDSSFRSYSMKIQTLLSNLKKNQSEKKNKENEIQHDELLLKKKPNEPYEQSKKFDYYRSSFSPQSDTSPDISDESRRRSRINSVLLKYVLFTDKQSSDSRYKLFYSELMQQKKVNLAQKNIF